MNEEQELDATNPVGMLYKEIKPALFANAYELIELPEGMIQITFGHYINGYEIVPHPTGIILSRKDAASVGASILSLAGDKNA